MPVALSFRSAPQYLVATCTGAATLQDFFGAIDALAAETRRVGATRLLVDLRGVTEQFRFTDQFSIGERARASLSHLERMASLVPEHRRTGTSEQVANQQGILLRVFTLPAAADAWLSQP
ncbi:hypothetical protein ACFPOE_04790 [Caenimonas terrae]|uniref:STAS/SEC14 domain-containing protein n=1 Tax=Caenimonas terrae TaxID=696074 RepID=A0ABW0NBA0_9BURK